MKSHLPLTAVLLLVAHLSPAGEVEDLIRKGDALDDQLKTREALEVYLQANEQDPGNASVLHRVSREYGLSMDDVKDKDRKIELGEKALQAAQQAVKADPRSAKAHLALAVSYGRLAQLLDNKTKLEYSRLVKQSADQALALDSKDDLTYHVLGVWNYELANLNPLVRGMAKIAYGELPNASNEEAIRYLKKAASLNPQRLGTYVELGRAYEAEGMKEKAKASYEKALGLPIREKEDEEAKERARQALR